MAPPVLTDKHKAYIKANYLKKSSRLLAKRIGCSRTAVQRFLKLEGLKVPKDLAEHWRVTNGIGKTNFTKSEDKIIKREYLRLPIKQIVEKFMPKRSFSGVMGRIKAMGLDIPTEIIEERKRMGRIKPGSVSPNKGLKQCEYMSAEAIARCSATRFKKGHLPANTKADMEITVRKDTNSGIEYQYIRVSLGKWVLYQRWVWEQHNGPIPPGYLIAFKDGNSLNCDLSNLEMITKAENAIRNSGTIKLTDKTVAGYLATSSRKQDKELKEEYLKHPELIQLKRNQLLLNRAIKNHAKTGS